MKQYQLLPPKETPTYLTFECTSVVDFSGATSRIQAAFLYSYSSKFSRLRYAYRLYLRILEAVKLSKGLSQSEVAVPKVNTQTEQAGPL